MRLERPLDEPLMIRQRPPHAVALAFLESAGLPVADLTDRHLEHFFFAGSDGSPKGLIGLEIYSADALLRSLVVAESERGKGLGRTLVQHAEQYAASQEVRSLYLLTVTAPAFFQNLGYERIERARAPASIKRTSEFASLCPASSAFMVKNL